MIERATIAGWRDELREPAAIAFYLGTLCGAQALGERCHRSKLKNRHDEGSPAPPVVIE